MKSVSERIDLIDSEKKGNRELEGEDTITPLTNATFLKEINKLKLQNVLSTSRSSLKSSSNHSIANENAAKISDDQISLTSMLSKRLKDSVPESLQKLFAKKPVNDVQFFHSKASHAKKRFYADSTDADITNMNLRKGDKLAASCGDFDKITNHDHENPLEKISFFKTMSCSLKNSVSVTNSNANKACQSATALSNTAHQIQASSTDQVYDAISLIMSKNVLIEKDFVESIRLIVRQSEQIRKRRLDFSIFICRVILCVFLALMMMFFVGFFYTLNSISNEFRVKNLYEATKNTTF